MSSLADRTTTDETTARSWRMSASRSVHPSVACGDTPLVETIAAGLAAVTAPWELTAPVAGERSYQLLLSTELYDAWVIHWPAGTGLDAHDHGGSTGAFAVVSGQLAETRLAADGTSTVRRVGPGESVAFGADAIHAVANQASDGATSVHVYSPPLGAMSFYEAGTDGRPIVVPAA